MRTNRIVISGNLTRDAELRQTANGNEVCSFRIGHNPVKGEAFFLDVSLWGSRGAALTEYLTKGTTVCVDGTLSVREFEHNGEKRVAHEIRADDVQFAGGSREGISMADSGSDSDDSDDDLPF